MVEFSHLLNEKPSYIFDDVQNKVVYICYAREDDILETTPKWKVEVIDYSEDNHVKIKRTSFKFYDVPICIGTINKTNIENTLRALYNSVKYKRTV